MSNTKSRKLISLILAGLMAGSAFASTAFAETPAATTDISAEAPTEDSGNGVGGLTDITEILSTKSYAEYIAQYEALPEITESFKIDIAESSINKDETDAAYSILGNYEGSSGAVLHTGDSGTVTFNINVPETGLYSLRINYMPAKPSEGMLESTVSIERTLHVNGKVPFSEARFVRMVKKWVNEYAENGRFEVDQNGNELRPDTHVDYVWQDYIFTDYNGYFNDPLCIYLEKGENTIALEAVRQDVYISEIEFFQAEEPAKYEDVLEEYAKKGYKDYAGEAIYLDAETPSALSHYSIYASSDSVSPSTEPQSAKASLRNEITSSSAGEWIEYEVEVPESAIYTFVFRFRQDASSNPVSRKILIDGELPYDQAQYAKFGFADNWQTGVVSNGDTELKFYLEKGTHTIRFEANLGEIGEYLRRVSAVQTALNADYLEIIRLTGAEPDEYRDYGFARVIPGTMRDLVDQAKELKDVLAYFEGEGDLSEMTSTLSQIADRVMSMGTDEDLIAKNLDALKNDLSTLGSWVSSMLSQRLEVDYILVQAPGADIPKAEAGFFQGAWYEIKKFFYSFVIDYNSLAENEEGTITGDPVEVWSKSSRDQVQIIKDLTDSKFTPDAKIPVTVKLVADGTLLPSVLAGIGPDVALDGMTYTSTAVTTAAATTAGSIVDYAVRGAVLPLEDLEGFEDAKAGIYASAFESVSLDDPEGNDHVYGLPVSLDWNMMFYRRDILGALGIGTPETWDDVLASVPVLQFNNMTVGLTKDVPMYASMIYQNNGKFWADNGMRVNFEDNTALESFEYMVNMFTHYSLPLTFDGVNRFRTGELPLFIAAYTTYNNITIFATELAGLWGFGPIPGTVQDDGTINNAVVGTSDAITMLRGCEVVDEAWAFMQWFADAEFQAEYSNELVNLLGEAGMRSVASKGALEQLQWKESDREALIEQADDVICLRQYPGSYFITRYVEFAVNNAYNDDADPVELLLGYTPSINKEISRKREEFGFETLEIGQTLAEKRMEQAVTAMDELSSSDAESYKDELEAARKAIEEAEIAALEDSAKALDAANSELFKDIIVYLNDTAEALRSYQ